MELSYARRPPTSHPRPNVMEAATNPSNTCRPPDLSSGAPVVSVMPIPTMNKPRIPRNTLASTAHPTTTENKRYHWNGSTHREEHERGYCSLPGRTSQFFRISDEFFTCNCIECSFVFPILLISSNDTCSHVPGGFRLNTLCLVDECKFILFFPGNIGKFLPLDLNLMSIEFAGALHGEAFTDLLPSKAYSIRHEHRQRFQE